MITRKSMLLVLIACNALSASSAHASLWQSIKNQTSQLFEKPYVYATATVGLTCMGALAYWLYKKHTKSSTETSEAPKPHPKPADTKKERLLQKVRASASRLQKQKKLHEALDALIKGNHNNNDCVFYGSFCAQIKALRHYLTPEHIAAIDSMPMANNVAFWQETLPQIYFLNKEWNEGLVGRIHEAETIIAQIESQDSRK